MAEPQLFGRSRLMRQIEGQQALGRRVAQENRLVLGKLEIHENRGIVDLPQSFKGGVKCRVRASFLYSSQ